MSKVTFKYGEDEYFQRIIEYIESTYSSHYALDEQLQALDVWKALGSAQDTCRDTALKYLMRFGRKDGNNRKDLYKAIHYILLMMHFEDASKPKTTTEEIK